MVGETYSFPLKTLLSFLMTDYRLRTRNRQIYCLQVTGEANEKQVRETLRRYLVRPLYMQKSLYTLFSFTQDMFEPREDIIQVHVTTASKIVQQTHILPYSFWST